MEKKLKCVAINKNANNTATAVFHEIDDKGKLVFAMQITTFNTTEVDEFTHQGDAQVVISNLMAKQPTPVQ